MKRYDLDACIIASRFEHTSKYRSNSNQYVVFFLLLFTFIIQFSGRQDNLDIAASIKALAKSVHGETVFGDLPKPRFSSQI